MIYPLVLVLANFNALGSTWAYSHQFSCPFCLLQQEACNVLCTQVLLDSHFSGGIFMDP